MSSPADQPALPAGVRVRPRGGRDVLVVDTQTVRAEVSLDGGQLISWSPSGQEDLLWLSPLARSGAGEAVRGGIPLVAPWFGPGRHGDRSISHGWLRTAAWSVLAAGSEGEEILLELVPARPSAELGAHLTLRLGTELSVDLTITAHDAPLELEAALHTYLAVADVREIAIDGLGGAAFLDNTRELAADVQGEQTLRLTGPTDRIYDSAAQVTITDPATGRRIVSTPRGTAQTVVWNPWERQAAQMDDIPDGAWPQFVCIEPALAKDRFLPLAPGQSHTIGVTYRLES